MRKVMSLVRRALDVVIAQHPEVLDVVDMLREGREVSGLPEKAVSEARHAVARWFL